jgi:hypothetical protein
MRDIIFIKNLMNHAQNSLFITHNFSLNWICNRKCMLDNGFEEYFLILVKKKIWYNIKVKTFFIAILKNVLYFEKFLLIFLILKT